jgi:hypothetical protein
MYTYSRDILRNSLNLDLGINNKKPGLETRYSVCVWILMSGEDEWRR